MFKKITRSCLAFMLILSIFTAAISVGAMSNSSLTLSDSEYHSGKIIPAEMTNLAFANNVEYNALSELQYKNTLVVTGDNVSLDIILLINSFEEQLQFEGKLFKSHRYTEEKPVYVGSLENSIPSDSDDLLSDNEQISNYEAIYFEISNDTSPYSLNNNLRDSPSITLYLRNSDGTIYDLSGEMSPQVILEGVTEQAPSHVDLTWFQKFFPATYGETQNIPTRNRRETRWQGNLHTLTYQIAGYEHKLTARPYIDFGYGDVPYDGMRNFNMTLKLLSTHEYRLVGSDENGWIENTGNYTNCFLIDSVQLTWTAGGNTLITHVTPELHTHIQGKGNFAFAGIAATVTSLLPQTAALSTILSLADSILGLNTGTSESFENNSLGDTLFNTSVHKLKFPAGYYIEEGADYTLPNNLAEKFGYTATMETIDSSLTQNYWTYAVADFSFRLRWADITGQSGEQQYSESKSIGYYNNSTP